MIKIIPECHDDQWMKEIFEKRKIELQTAKPTYWGPMLIQCKMSFKDGHEFTAYIYARMPN